MFHRLAALHLFEQWDGSAVLDDANPAPCSIQWHMPLAGCRTASTASGCSLRRWCWVRGHTRGDASGPASPAACAGVHAHTPLYPPVAPRTLAAGEGPCLLTIFVTSYWQLFTLRLLTGIALGGALGGGRASPGAHAAERPAGQSRRSSLRKGACMPCRSVHPDGPGPSPAPLQAPCRWCSRCWGTCMTQRCAPASPAWCRCLLLLARGLLLLPVARPLPACCAAAFAGCHASVERRCSAVPLTKLPRAGTLCSWRPASGWLPGRASPDLWAPPGAGAGPL